MAATSAIVRTMTPTSGRLLKLLSLLQARRDWPGDELARRLEVSGRTIRRDVGRLRDLGYPIEASTGPAGGYRLHAGTAMPPLLLDDDEAVAIAVGLRTAAGASVTGIEETSVRALVKLEQVLPSRLRRRVQALGAVTVSAPAPEAGPTVDAEALTAIAGACRDRERLRFDYARRDGTESSRQVEPHSLVHLGRRWYLLAWDCEREDWRTFRVDRLRDLRPAASRFVPRPAPADDVAAYVASRLSDAPYRYQARITLHAPAADIVARHPYLQGQVTALDERTCELRTSDDVLDWLAVRIGMLGVDFEVHEPPELVERCELLAHRYGHAALSAPA
jgi:predicted DNA-binding transcriptional regulator YafY